MPMAGQTLTIDATKVVGRIESLIYGAGAEDVNHEIYGGLYDQRIFGEGFEEPSAVDIRGFKAYDEKWGLTADMLQLTTSRHGKIVYNNKTLTKGIVEVEMRIDDKSAIAGFILNVSDPGEGADAFNGYEIALNASTNHLVLGKHQQNWQPMEDIAATFKPVGQWNKLRVSVNGGKLQVYINSRLVRTYEDKNNPLTEGLVGLRSYGGSASFRNLKIDGEEVPFESTTPNVSRMWTAIGDGSFDHDSTNPFTGHYSQHIAGNAGVGIYNMGLNRWGIGISKGETLHVSLYLKGKINKVAVALQSADGNHEYARTQVEGIAEDWQRFNMDLTPNETDPTGRFALLLDDEGEVWVDQVLLCTDTYPFRQDITEAFRQEQLTFLRYGGTMVNAAEYMTKDMLGSNLERQPYHGHWYTYATNGFAIPEFVQFARMINTEPTFAINIEDNPKDVLALLHELEHYNLHYLEIGNEENLNSIARRDYEHYVERYLVLYNAIHDVYPELKFINAAWWRADQLETMEYVFHQLDGKCDLWDYHPWTETPQQAKAIEAEIAQMKKLFLTWNPQTNMRCAILEENGNTHNMARALAHAVMLNVVRRAGSFVPLDSPANALQPYKQNDNGWDQGQIFFSPSQTWMQPPYYAQQMAASTHMPLLLYSKHTNVSGLDITVTGNEAGDSIVIHAINYSNSSRNLNLSQTGFGPISAIRSISLSGSEGAANSPEHPTQYVPVESSVTPGSRLPLKPYSYTVFVITTDSPNGIVGKSTDSISHTDEAYNLSGQMTAPNQGGIIVQYGRKTLY